MGLLSRNIGLFDTENAFKIGPHIAALEAQGKKVVKCNGGSGLLRDLPRIRNIFESVRAAVKIPFTVKFRAGWSDKEVVHVKLAKMAEECGLAAVALHARTREQGYS